MLATKIHCVRIEEKIRKLRKEGEYSQRQIAEKLSKVLGKKYIYQQIGFMESGERKEISGREAKALAGIFRVNVEYLLDDSKGYPLSNGDRLDYQKPLPETTREEAKDHLYGKFVDKIILTEKNIELWAEPGQRLATLKRSEQLVIEGEGLSLFFRKKE